MNLRVKDIEIVVGNKHAGATGEYVGRPSPLGNPFNIKTAGREESIKAYKVWIKERIAAKDVRICRELERLKQKALKEKKLNLVCWCVPLECHGSVVASLIADAIASGKSFGTEIVRSVSQPRKNRFNWERKPFGGD